MTHTQITVKKTNGQNFVQELVNEKCFGDTCKEVSMATDGSTERCQRTAPFTENGLVFHVTRFFGQMRRKTALNFTFASALVMMTEISLAVFLVTQVTALEKEFGFTSLQSGRLLSANEIGFLCFVLPGGYLARKLHMPRALAVTAMCVGLTGVMFGLPHFLFPRASTGSHISEANYTGAGLGPLQGSGSVVSADARQAEAVEEEVHGRCEAVYAALRARNSSGQGQAGQEVVFNERAYPVFVYLSVFQLIKGAMGSWRMPLFVEYIETNAKETDTGFYFGIVAAIAMLGPAMAFLVGGIISQVHVSLEPTTLTPTHPEWVGAWWLGMMLFGGMTILAPVFLLRFPKQLRTVATVAPCPQPWPGAGVVEAVDDDDESDDNDVLVSNEGAKPVLVPSGGFESCRKVALKALAELREFLGSVAGLFFNLPLLLLVLSSCFLGFSMNGTYLFLPKYLQEQFSIPSWKANYIMGGAELSTGTTGFLLGGWLTRRLQLSLAGLYRLMVVITVTSALFVVSLMFIGCPQPYLIGALGQNDTDNNACVSTCFCPEEVFPVCDRFTGENYFSPCHAGCIDLKDGVYTNCSCTASGQVHPGVCSPPCVSIYIFSAAFYAFLFMLSASAPMNYLLLIRTVTKEQAGLAVGFNSFAVGIVGFLVGPMVFGGLIDSFCRHWKTSCGQQGQCSVYDNQRFRVHMHLYCVVATGLAAACVALSYVCYRLCPPTARQARDLVVWGEPPAAGTRPDVTLSEELQELKVDGSQAEEEEEEEEEEKEEEPTEQPGKKRS